MFETVITKIANRILYLLFYSTWRKFWKNSNHLEHFQTKYLLGIIKKNAQTQFGIQHNFNELHHIIDFQKNVPISNYENYIEFIKAIKNGEKSVLTSDEVIKFSLSSGTASASKNIPNTKTLIHEFDTCISVWLCDLYQHYPQTLNGKAFWIITPSTNTPEIAGVIKNGFDNDSEYFSPIKQWLIRNIFAVPDEVARYCEGENYYFVLATFLLSDKNLRLISVWNPSVLLIFFDKILYYQKQIVESIQTGQLRVPNSMDLNHLKILEKRFKKNPRRAKELKVFFESNTDKSELFSAIWPKLTLISAWDSAWACSPALQVTKLFPKVAFQGKGLLATEACVSFPINTDNCTTNYIPAYLSHFFEFENTDNKEIKLLYQLQINATYEVIVTTGGGLYRYRLHDIVRCYGFFKGLPLLRFEGKSNVISDIVGEKLHESHVAQVLHTVFNELNIESSFYFIAPEIHEKCCYVLFMNSSHSFNIKNLQQKVEVGLCENFHYKHCRKLEQLGELKIKLLNDDSILRFYAYIQSNSPIGSFKQTVLRKEQFWTEKLI